MKSDTLGPALETAERSKSSLEGSTNHQFFHSDYSDKYRWILISFVVVLTLFLGPPTMNWPPLRDMIGDSGAFNFLCNNPDNKLNVTCDAKTTALENLGGTCTSLYYSCIILSGILLDCFGAKICTIVGFCVNAFGWLLVSLSRPQFHAFQAGLYLVAMSGDCAFLGIISVGNLFWGYTSTVVAVFGAARSVSFAIPLIMAGLYNKGYSLMAVTMGFAIILICLGVATAITIPFRPFPKFAEDKRLVKTKTPNSISLKEYVSVPPKVTWACIKENAADQANGIISYLLKPSYWAFVVVMCIALIRVGYYIETTPTHLKSTEPVYSIMNPLSFIPCPMFGFVVDKLSAALASGILASCGLTAMAFAMIGGIVCEYFSIIANWAYISFIASQCYCYISYIYPQHVLGKLTGFTFLVAGLSSFATNSMNKFTKRSRQNLYIMDSIVTIMGISAVAICVLLYIYLEKPQRQRIKLSEAKREDEENQINYNRLKDTADV